METRNALEYRRFENGLRINALVNLSEKTDPFSSDFEKILAEIRRLHAENENINIRIYEIAGREIEETQLRRVSYQPHKHGALFSKSAHKNPRRY